MTRVTINVGMADLKVAKAPYRLMTLGLGSCVGVAVYDTQKRIGGLIHIMLPDSTQIKQNSNEAKFADTGIEALIREMLQLGASKQKMIAKVAGGANMFQHTKQIDASLNIGMRNVVAVNEILAKYQIPIVATDTGRNYGRTIAFDLETGLLHIKTIENGTKEI